ncbi:O-antigen ligase family protein [Neobacillus cucumis]|uniref:O-antigen ligase family protein n=1 Tax=Neobacillus cucumis TaxID=1740721 RepID=UPI0018DF197C|nr:O-antigen ligase family protein [Neobacillus cucumis]MBI0576523.1 O-antigen ligase family protein [Neobacillus cucumis]
MYWFILLFPLLIYPWGYDPYYTTTKANYLYIFVLVAWLSICYKKKYRLLIPKKGEATVEFLIIIFLCLIELSTAFSKSWYTSIFGLIDRKEGLISYFAYCSLFIFSYRMLNLKKLNKLLTGISIVSALVSTYGILQHYLLDFLPRNSFNLNTTRSYAFFDNPNFFGSYLVLVILLTLTLFLIEKNYKLSLLHYISICLSFTALIFSGTRSGWVGVFIGIAFMSVAAIIKNKYLWKKWSLLLISLALIVILLNNLEKGTYTNRITTAVTDSYHIVTNESTGLEGSSRLFIWEKSIPLIKKYFWLGSGPDTFEFVFHAKPDELQRYFGDPNIIVDKAHNEYLQIAITLGIPALITYLLLLLYVFTRTLQAVKKAKDDEKILLFGLMATILGYLGQAFFNISTVPVAPLFWAVLGITLAKSSVYLKSKSSNIENFNQSA